jgi:multiple sugar transport system substrate-binding protein
MNKKIAQMGLLSVLALTVGLTGCGAKQEASAGKTADNQTGKPVTIKIISVSQTEKPDGPAEKEIADEYMRLHPNIKIEFIGVPLNDLFKKLTTLATAGDLPDAFTNTPEFMRTAYGMNITADLTKLLGDQYLKEFYPYIVEESSVDGKLQFFPWNATPQALIYRGDWFEAEGLKAPETWDDFVTVAKKLTKDTNGDGKPDQWGFGMVGTRNSSGGSRFIPVLRSFGADELRKDASGKWVTDLDSPKAKEAFQFYGDLFTKHGVVPPGVTETGFPEAATLMANGKVGMLISGPNALGTILAQNPSLKGKLYSAPIPKKDKNVSTFGLLGYSISAESKNKEAVADYLKFVVNKENSLKWNAISGRLPTRVDVGENQQLNTPEMVGFSKSIANAFHVPNFSTYTQFQDIVAEAYQMLLAKGGDVDAATKKAAGRANELIQKEGK